MNSISLTGKMRGMNPGNLARRILFAALATVTLAAAAVDSGEARESWHRMSPEERRQMREQIREHWKSMTPEEREAHRERMRERLSRMPPEERERMREQLRRHRHRHGGEGQVESGA